VTCLGDPPPCLPVGVAGLEVDLFSAGADVWLKPLLEHELADVGVVVAAVKAQPLGLLGGRDRPRDRDRLKRVGQELLVVTVGAVVRDADRDTLRLGQDRPFRPPFALSVGFGPVFAPPSGALLIAPSQERNDQSMPIFSSYSKSPWRQIS
jgi:hypothetical protein